MAAQLHGARIGVTLYRKYTRKAIEQEREQAQGLVGGGANGADTAGDEKAGSGTAHGVQGEERDVEKGNATSEGGSTTGPAETPITPVTLPFESQVWRVENVEEEVKGR
jgi:hypothetical protein